MCNRPHTHTPLDEETVKLTSTNFLQNNSRHSLKHLLNKVLLSFTSMISYFYRIQKNIGSSFLNNFILLVQKNLKLAPEKSFFMLLKVKLLEHEIGYNTIKPIHSKIAAIHKIPCPTGKVALMSFIGAPNFYTNFIEKLHINCKRFCDLLHENTPWKWTDEHEYSFQTLKTSLTSEQNLQFLIQNTYSLLQ